MMMNKAYWKTEADSANLLNRCRKPNNIQKPLTLS